MTDLLVADIGGTGSRLGVMVDGSLTGEPTTYANIKYASFEAILADFLSQQETLPAQAAFAVAGPVRDNSVHMTNLGWSLSGIKISAATGIERVEIINDYAALAWSTLSLEDSALLQVGGGSPRPDANRAIIGPGTGLGVSGLIHGDNGWVAMAGEGGHVTLSATTHAEAELIAGVAREFGHCSAERLVSGPGLVRIYTGIGGEKCAPEKITELAFDGEATAAQAMEIFCALLGTVASNLALTVGAHGGVYLGGGILPAMTEVFAASGFRKRFEAKARLGDYLAEIPTYVIAADYPSFAGLAAYVQRKRSA